MTCLRIGKHTHTHKKKTLSFAVCFYMLFVVEAVCFLRLTQSKYSSGKNNTSFNVGEIILHNGITEDNDFLA